MDIKYTILTYSMVLCLLFTCLPGQTCADPLEDQLPDTTGLFFGKRDFLNVANEFFASLGYKNEYTKTTTIITAVYSKGDSEATIRCKDNGEITCDLHDLVKQSQNDVDEFSKKFSTAFDGITNLSLPAIERHASFNRYFPTTDNRIIEYDFTKLLFERQSEFQNVKIYDSPSYGGMLVIDDDPNLAESDILYTKAITGNDTENYEGKSVFILGGGDGGILHELLKKNPKEVIMVDIDMCVIEGAKKYMRRTCGDCLDNLKGENYEVLVEDCIPVMKKYIEQGKTFDFVINDLTAVPCGTASAEGDLWNFLRLILDLSMQILSKTGKYYTQGNGSNMVESLKLYEQQLSLLKHKVDFEKHSFYVPSYHELWVFYEIWKC